jgi:hypothetical protein
MHTRWTQQSTKTIECIESAKLGGGTLFLPGVPRIFPKGELGRFGGDGDIVDGRGRDRDGDLIGFGGVGDGVV